MTLQHVLGDILINIRMKSTKSINDIFETWYQMGYRHAKDDWVLIAVGCSLVSFGIGFIVGGR